MKDLLREISCLLFLSLILSFGSCAQSEAEMMKLVKEQKWGYAVLKEKVDTNAINFSHLQMKINEVEDAQVFTKSMFTYGMDFRAMNQVSNDFLRKVGKCYQEMLPQDSSLDLELQHRLINTLSQYATTIPVLSGHHNKMSKETEQEMFAFEMGNYSVCDVIMIEPQRQTMEVVEHLLHHISDVGLFYIFPNEWAFNNENATIVKSMNIAIDKKCFRIEDYKELQEIDDELYQRILVQEYAYWIISTYWNIQEKYGPNEKEWRIRNKKELQEKLPLAYELIETTVNDIIVAPSDDIMSSF
ncbi:hypothetical protein HNS38_02080 [Lentimicrobium sp. L6]|nr:hypothetical protein [Lentimicrobium sp. L6]